MDKAKRCDGYYDCRDKSDESDGCAGIACELGQFRCKDGNKCIAKYQKCNHRNECDDASDEENCSEYTCPFCVSDIARLRDISICFLNEGDISCTPVVSPASTICEVLASRNHCCNRLN